MTINQKYFQENELNIKTKILNIIYHLSFLKIILNMVFLQKQVLKSNYRFLSNKFNQNQNQLFILNQIHSNKIIFLIKDST